MNCITLLYPHFSQFTGYNVPERSKHRKSVNCSLSSRKLRELSQELFTHLQRPWFLRQSWHEMQMHIRSLACSLSDYADELTNKCQEMKTNHMKTSPVRSPEDCETFTIINPVDAVNVEFISANDGLFQSLEKADIYDPITLNEFLPSDPKARFRFMEMLHANSPYSLVRFTHAYGNNRGNIHFLWKIPPSTSSEELLTMNHSIASSLASRIDKFHTRAMRKGCIGIFWSYL